MDIKYSQLLEAHRNRLASERGSVSPQVLRNQLSTLNTFLLSIGKGPENRVGREFLGDFAATAKTYLTNACAGNRKTAADKMSHLRAWKRTLDGLVSAGKRNPASGVSRFHTELRVAFAKSTEPPKTVVRRIGGSTSAVNRWLAGAFPNQRALPTLRRLEQEFGMARGQLEGLLPSANSQSSVPKGGLDGYSRRHAANVEDAYYFPKSELGDRFKADWFAFLRYKTSESPVGLRRSKRGRWRVLSSAQVDPTLQRHSWAQLGPGSVCPSAARCFAIVIAYLGFLRKAPNRDVARCGLGLSGETIQSLAFLAVPEYVAGYFAFMKARSGGLVHGGHDVAAAMIRSLLKPAEGYLAQQPHLIQDISKHTQGRSWEVLCAQTYELCGQWQKAVGGKKSRDPKTAILPLLRLESPLKPLWRAIQELDKEAAAAAPGGIEQATIKRDALFLAMLMANPLRARTYTITKYISPRDSGAPFSDELETNLYQTESGGWRLRFSKGDFKNDAGRDEDYDAPLPRLLNARIADYLFEFRPVLVRANPGSPWLFPSSRTGGKITNLGSVIAKIAQRHIPEASRLGPQAVRHLVASDFLAKNPGQYTVIAELLHDNLDTVLKNYAHQKQETSFRAHEQHLQRVFGEG